MSGISQGSGIGDGGELTASEEALIASIASLGSASQVLAVNATADGVEWKTISLSSVWGSITGTLSDQTDLQSALDAKLNSSAVSVFGATLIDDADAATARTTLGLVIGTNVQAYSAVLSATTASFLTAQETKLGYISVTQPVDIDDIESKANSAIQAADLGSAAYLDAGSSAGNVPVLDGGGKLSSGVLPAIALTNVSLVASQAAQLALTAQEGDVAVRSDESKTYIHNGGSAGDMTDWTEMQSPTGGVSSVFGRSGAVTAQTGDYTAAQVTNAFDKTVDTLDGITAGSTNVHFTSVMSSKLSGIEALADVTDATNVAASGAIMDGDFSVNGLMKRTAAGTYGTATEGTDYYAPSGTDVAVADGGTGVSSVTTTPSASAFAGWDANKNLSANNLIDGYTTTATAAGTTTLTIASTGIQAFTGTSTQTVKLPTTSVVAGGQYVIINQSTGAVTVQSSGANTIVVLAAGASALFTALVATPTTAANWMYSYSGVNLTTAINEAQSTNIASATTTDIGAATGNYVNITGTTTITGLGTIQAGTRRIVNFTGALTLTHNATSLILPTAANITTAAGDTATFVSLGSGNWKCVSYDRASGAALATSGGGASNFVRVGMSANQLDIGAREIVQFNTEEFDSGGNFNTSTYKYTAPSDGYYLVSFTLRLVVVGGTSAQGDIFVDGASVGLGFQMTAEHPTTDNKGVVTGSQIVYVTSGLTIDIRVETGATTADVEASTSYVSICKLA